MEMLVTNFQGGVNTKDDIQSINNNQLSKGSNIIITRDGSIQNRPGIHYLNNVANAPGTSKYRVLGSYGNNLLFSVEDIVSTFDTTDIFACNMDVFDPSSRIFLRNSVISTDPRDGAYPTYIPDAGTGNYAVKVLPYLDNLIVINKLGTIFSINYSTVTDNLEYPGSHSTGTVGGGFTSVTNADSVLIWKDRLFLADVNGRIYYSAATDLLNFSSPNGGYFVVGSEENLSTLDPFSGIQQLLLLGDVMYIFKSNAIYAFTFQTDPGTDGYLRVISSDKGAQKATLWNNRIFTADFTGVYELVNSRLVSISSNIDIYITGNSDCGALFVFNDYLIARYNADCVVMNLFTGAWTHWNTPEVFSNPILLEVKTSPVGAHSVAFMAGADGYFSALSLLCISTKAPKYDTITVGTYAAAGSEGSPGVGTPGTAHLSTPSFETKMFTFDSPWTVKKIRKVFIDRGGSYPASPTPQQGWRVKYYAADNVENTITYAPSDNRFGRLVLGGNFRCYHFKVMYDFSYSGTPPTTSFDFNINSLLVEYTSGSKYPKSDGTFNK